MTQDRDLALLVAIAHEAGALALGHFRAGVRHWEKGKGDPVSEADLAVDRLIAARIAEARPAYGWLSEESVDDPARLAAEAVLVVDPIDGTRGFIKGKTQFTVALAVVRQGRPVAAVVHAPAEDRLFAAAAGRGATLNGRAIRVTDRADLAGSQLIGTEEMFRSRRWPTPWPADLATISFPSIAYALAMVAGGQADGSVSLTGKSDWDLAAADLLVHEAGGRVTDHGGRPFRYNQATTRHPSVISAGPALHDRLVEKLATLRPA